MGKKICFIVSVPLAVDLFLRPLFAALHAKGFELALACRMDERFIASLPPYVRAHRLNLHRGMDLAGLLPTIVRLTGIFRREQFDLIQYSTPGTAFCAAVAGHLASVPARLYCQWGLAFQLYSGVTRVALEAAERLTCALSTEVQPDSEGNLKLCRKRGFYGEAKSRVIGYGSASGIDLGRFNVRRREEWRGEIRALYGIGEDDIVLGFVGRLTVAKGFNELLDAFRELKKGFPCLKLLVAGPMERPRTVRKDLLDFFVSCGDISYSGGWVLDHEKYLAAMDVFMYPSHMEGFGNIVAEAQAMGVPVVVSDIPGPQNGMLDGVTGYKVPVGEVGGFVSHAGVLLGDGALRASMGEAGVKFVRSRFDSRYVVGEIVENRMALLERAEGRKK